jgi:hypothetical protein
MLFQTLAQTLWIQILKFYEHILGQTRELNYHSIYCEHDSWHLPCNLVEIHCFRAYHLQLRSILVTDLERNKGCLLATYFNYNP